MYVSSTWMWLNLNSRLLFWFIIILSHFNLRVHSSISTTKVIELSDRFLDVWKDGYWLVKFYAPWCGHCKKLEPVYSQVAQALYGTNIKIGKVDCTRFTSVASEFGIKGFPTILFLKYGEIFTFKGDRSLNDIVSFTHKVSGPPVKHIPNGEFNKVIHSHADDVVFVYIGEWKGILWDSFNAVALKYHEHNFFYETSPGCFAEHSNLNDLPAVGVFKGQNHTFFKSLESSSESSDKIDTNNTLHKWVNDERFPVYSRVTHTIFHQMLTTGKYLVLVVLEENKIGDLTEEMEQFRDMVGSIVEHCHIRNPSRFQFGWVTNPDLANSIAMEHLPVPSLVVVNSATYHHHIPDDDPNQLTTDAVMLFLENILAGSVTIYGGDTYTVRAYRLYFEAKSSLSDMWRGNPILTSVLFGLPIGFLSLICYSVCCADIMDAEDEDAHHKQE